MKLRYYFSVTLCLCFGAFAEDCSNSLEVLECFKHLNFAEWKYLEFPETEELLDKRCKQKIPYLRCLDNRAKHCPSSFIDGFRDLLLRMIEAEERLCSPGNALRSRYVQACHCLNKHAKAIQKCEFSGIENVSSSKKSIRCEGERKSIDCYVETIKEACGEAVLDVAKAVSSPLLNFFEEKCS